MGGADKAHHFKPVGVEFEGRGRENIRKCGPAIFIEWEETWLALEDKTRRVPAPTMSRPRGSAVLCELPCSRTYTTYTAQGYSLDKAQK